MTQIRYKMWDANTTSPFDILFKDFFNANSTFASPIDNKIGHPVDIYENKEGLHFEIACTGLAKSDVEINIEGDLLRISHTKKEEDKCCETNDCNYYHKGIARRSFNLGYKIARKFDLSQVDAKMTNGLLHVNIPYSAEGKPSKVVIK